MTTKPMQHKPAALTDLVRPEDYVHSRSHVFRSMESFRWWYRTHRAALFERGAVLEVGGRTLVHEIKTDEAVMTLSATPRKSARDGRG